MKIFSIYKSTNLQIYISTSPLARARAIIYIWKYIIYNI